MSGLSSGTGSCGGEGARFLRGGGEGERSFLGKKLRMVLFLDFFCDDFAAFAGGGATGISSSVAGGVDSSESEADMVLVVGTRW